MAWLKIRGPSRSKRRCERHAEAHDAGRGDIRHAEPVANCYGQGKDRVDQRPHEGDERDGAQQGRHDFSRRGGKISAASKTIHTSHYPTITGTAPRKSAVRAARSRERLDGS